MKIYLLPESGNFYKANLHCHSTVSDDSRGKGAYTNAYFLDTLPTEQ